MARAPKDEFGTTYADAKPKSTLVVDQSVAEARATVAEARAAAAGSAAAAGGTITDGKYTPPAKPAAVPTAVPVVPAGGDVTVFDIVDNNDGTKTIVYTNGKKEIIGNKTDTTPAKPTTNIDILKAGLKGLGFSAGVIDASTGFLNNLLSEGLDYDNATDIFLNNQDYTLKNGTKMKSPFYTEYGYLNEGLASPKTPSELYNAVEGYKTIQQRFNLDAKFVTPDYMKDLVKNNVDVDTFGKRANVNRLAAINTDPNKVAALVKLGFIKDATGLTDFYMDNKIGQEVMEQNLNTAAFVTEAVRRSKSGISIDAAYAKKVGAELTGKGLSEAQVSGVAAQGYEAIAQTLQPEVALSNIFEGSNAANAQTIQAELEAEEFQGVGSDRRKKLKELGTNIFNQQTGMYTGRAVANSKYSSAGMI